tara:strand:+ start:426 stop:1256 length:831 start_codon:yes stop_codon:yes gene_type:complete
MGLGYYQVTVKPTITASKQHLGAFVSDDVLFDWTKFRVPRRLGRLIGCTALVRGTDGADQQSAIDLYFSKSDSYSMGTLHGGVAVQPNDDFLGAMSLKTSSYMDGLNTMEVANIATTSRISLEPVKEPIGSGTAPNQNYCLWVAGVAQASINFSTAVETTGAHDVSGLSTASIGSLDDGSGGGASCNTKFAPGDIIHAEDDIILGELATVAAATLTFRHDGVKKLHAGGITLYNTPADFAAWQIQNGAGAAGDLADGDELYNVHPITLTFTFEGRD